MVLFFYKGAVLFRGPERDPDLENYPHSYTAMYTRIAVP